MTLQNDYGVKLAYADEEVDATAADEGIAGLLETQCGSPVLRVRQVIYSRNGKATTSPTASSSALNEDDCGDF